MRMETVIKGNCILIKDCYNANPVSMMSALEYWHMLFPESKHIAILGDMLELGKDAVLYHKRIQEALIRMNYSTLLTVGNLSRNYHCKSSDNTREIVEKHFLNVSDELLDTIKTSITNNCVIIVKASHGLHLEQVCEYIEKQFTEEPNNSVTSD